MSRLKDRLLWVLLAGLFLFGAGVFFYPTYVNIYNQLQNSRVVTQYGQVVASYDADELERLWRDAEGYNASHTVNLMIDPFGNAEAASAGDGYEEQLNLGQDGVMASLEIPKINELLAVYHGTREDVLERGVGHVQGTSLPVGGPSSHCVIAGHRGVATAKIFTDLDQLASGDKFYLHVLDHYLAYEVDQVSVVEPEDIDALAILPGQDIVTLLTCTPYAVNTQRLLVRGHRVAYVPEEDDPILGRSTWRFPTLFAFVAPILFVVGVVIVVIVYRRRVMAKQ